MRSHDICRLHYEAPIPLDKPVGVVLNYRDAEAFAVKATPLPNGATGLRVLLLRQGHCARAPDGARFQGRTTLARPVRTESQQTVKNMKEYFTATSFQVARRSRRPESRGPSSSNGAAPPPAEAIPDFAAPDSHQQEVQDAVRRYLDRVRPLRIVSRILVGSRPAVCQGYLWNVFTANYSMKHIRRESFAQINDYVYQLERDLSSVLPIRISHIRPSDLDDLLSFCASEGIHTSAFQL